MYNDQPKDEPKHESKAVSCPKCSGYMFERNFLAANNAIFTRADVRVPLTFTHTSAAKSLVCDYCGYAEIYAAHPEKLRELATANG